MATNVPEALVRLASRCQRAPFYNAIKTILERHVTNGRVVGSSCSVLCAIFEGSGPDILQHVTAMRESGAMNAVLAGVKEHRGDRSVVSKLPQFVDLVLRDTAMRELLLKNGIAPFLMEVLQGSFRDEARVARREETWVADITRAARRVEMTIDAPVAMAAGFRCLQLLLCGEWVTEVVSSELIDLLMRALAVTQDDDVQRSAVSLLARVLHFIEQQLTWVACGGRGSAGSAICAEEVARVARAAHSAEMEGLRQWRSANHLLAAAQFRTAAAAYNAILTLEPSKQMREMLAQHLQDLPLAHFIRACETQHLMLHEETTEARTAVELSPAQRTSDCPICLDVLVPQRAHAHAIPRPLWRCETCTQWMHEHCVTQWRERNQTCPLCRQPMNDETVSPLGAYRRSKAVAAAAMNCMNGEAARAKSSGHKKDLDCAAFFALSVASLWRVCARVGGSLGVPGDEVGECRRQAALLEDQAGTCNSRPFAIVASVESISRSFEENFVQAWEAKAKESRCDNKRGILPLKVLQAMAVEVLKRRGAFIGEQAAVWEVDVARLETQGRYVHAEQLLMLICGQLSNAAGILEEAGIRSMALREHVEDIAARRQEALALRHLQAEDDGTVAVAHRERRPLLYFGACFNRPWERSNLQAHVIICMRAVAAADRASRVTINQGSSATSNSVEQTTARQIKAASGHVIHAMIQDRLPHEVAKYLMGDRNRICRLLAVAFFQQLQHCGEEARQVSFAILDTLLGALAAPRNAEDRELQACLCSLAHDLVFGGGCEERMVLRLQREASPRTATSLEEWFLDTLLIQHGAETFREKIQRPSQVDAWLCCGDAGASNNGLGAFFGGDDGGLAVVPPVEVKSPCAARASRRVGGSTPDHAASARGARPARNAGSPGVVRSANRSASPATNRSG